MYNCDKENAGCDKNASKGSDPVERAYLILLKEFVKGRGATFEDLSIAIEEAIGFLGEKLDK